MKLSLLHLDESHRRSCEINTKIPVCIINVNVIYLHGLELQKSRIIEHQGNTEVMIILSTAAHTK